MVTEPDTPIPPSGLFVIVQLVKDPTGVPAANRIAADDRDRLPSNVQSVKSTGPEIEAAPAPGPMPRESPVARLLLIVVRITWAGTPPDNAKRIPAPLSAVFSVKTQSAMVVAVGRSLKTDK